MEIRAPRPRRSLLGIKAPPTYAVAKKCVRRADDPAGGRGRLELVIENPLRLKAQRPAAYHSEDIKIGQPVGLKVASHPGTIFRGEGPRGSTR